MRRIEGASTVVRTGGAILRVEYDAIEVDGDRARLISPRIEVVEVRPDSPRDRHRTQGYKTRGEP